MKITTISGRSSKALFTFKGTLSEDPGQKYDSVQINIFNTVLHLVRLRSAKQTNNSSPS